MIWHPILNGAWFRHAAKARKLELTVSGTRTPGLFKVPSSRRVCDYHVYYERGRVSCSCPAGQAGNRCAHAGLLAEHIINTDPEYVTCSYNYLVRVELQRLYRAWVTGTLTPAEKREVKSYLMAGEAVVERLGLNEARPVLVSDGAPF